MSTLSARTIQRRMRVEVIEQARRCEHWAGKAQESADAGDEGAAICLRFVARQRSEAAFAAVAAAQELIGGSA